MVYGAFFVGIWSLNYLVCYIVMILSYMRCVIKKLVLVDKYVGSYFFLNVRKELVRGLVRFCVIMFL